MSDPSGFDQARQVPAVASKAALVVGRPRPRPAPPRTGHENRVLSASSSKAPTNAPTITTRVFRVGPLGGNQPAFCDICSIMPFATGKAVRTTDLSGPATTTPTEWWILGSVPAGRAHD